VTGSVGAPPFDLDEYLRGIDELLLTDWASPLAREGRLALTELDPLAFALLYLPHHLRGEEDGAQITLSEFHVELAEAAKRWALPTREPRADRDAYICPREAGKSTWLFLILPLWAAAHGHKRFIAAFADSGGQAEMHLLSFKRELDNNPLLRADFPELCTAARRPGGSTESDTKSMLVTKSGFVFATRGVDAKTLGMKLGNRRPDLIICHAAGTPMLHDGEWVPVEQHPTFRGFRETESRVIHVWGLPFKEVVTPEHRYWAKWVDGRRAKLRSADWCEAQDLDRRHYIGTPIDMQVEQPPPIAVWRRRIGERGPDGRVTAGSTYGTEYEALECFYDPEFWWVVGQWWGDGHVAGRYSVGITMSNAYPELKERLLDYLAKIGRTPTIVDRPGCQQIIWSWADINAWLRTWKKGPSRKTPPAWVERLPLDLQARLVDGYADADGWRTDVEVRITSIHLEGLLVLRRVLARLGHAATIRKGSAPRVEKFPNGVTSMSQQKYDLRWTQRQERYAVTRTHIADGYLWSKIRSVEVGGVEKFAPIKTKDSRYITHFGLSHNCDDIEPDEANYSEYQKGQRLSTVQNAILPLNIRARVVIAGTVTMPGSIMHDLVKTVTRPGEEAATWAADEQITVHYYQAIITDEATGERRSMWPAKWPLNFLLAIEHTRSYKLNYDNNPMGKDGDYWNESDFVHAELPGLTHELLSIDPAITSKKRSDFTALAVIGFSAAYRRCVVRMAMAVRVAPGDALRELVLRILEEFPGIRGVVVEVNQGGDVWKNSVLKGLPVPVRVVYQSEPKEVRAARTLGYYQTRPRRLPPGKDPAVSAGLSMLPQVVHETVLATAEEQMVGFPKGVNDDLVDAIGTGADVFLKPKRKSGGSSVEPRYDHEDDGDAF
jgi:hypothetical protein